MSLWPRTIACTSGLVLWGVVGPGVPAAGETVSLAGVWGFELDPDDQGVSQEWFTRELPQRILLPGSVTEHGFGDEISVDTPWTGDIIDRSWFTDPKYEKYRHLDNLKIPFWLQPLKHYLGAAWYQSVVTVPETWSGKRITLNLERCHWETEVWVDARRIGSANSLSTPHVYDLTESMPPGEHRLTVKVDNRLKINVGPNSHSVSDHTQTNWNGIVGDILLRATEPVWIEDVQVYPYLNPNGARVVVTIGNATGKQVLGTVTAEDVCPDHQAILAAGWHVANEGQSTIELSVPMGSDARLWDEFSPNLHRLTVTFQTGEHRYKRTVTFGMRELATEGTQFTINGRRMFLRGTLECAIFPLTGYPPTDVASWKRIFGVLKAHGLNHMRFHSWCPPEAAFAAADELGVYLHVECASWANQGSSLGDGKPIDRFILEEAERIVRAYGNHPSFCMLAYGNEPAGKNQKQFLAEFVRHWKEKDPRRLVTSAAGWPIIPESQYHSTPGPRGHQWGAGLSSRMNARPPETVTDYRDFVTKYEVPIVSHEIGQWCVYPNFNEIAKYTGVLRARNFEIFRDSLAEHHMLDQAHDFLMASGKLQAELYKEEIESALRTPGFGGFQLLDLHDFPGQGTALVGVLDPFWDSKGYISSEEFHQFCCQTVPLVRMAKRIWTTAETFHGEVEVAHFGPAPISDAVFAWSLGYADGRALASGRLPKLDVPIDNGIKLGQIDVPLAEADAPARLVLMVSLEGTAYRNRWDVWVYPPKLDLKPPADVVIAESLDENALSELEAGRKVLLMSPLAAVRSNVPPGFTTIFWNTAWTRRQPPHTLGILCDPKHPALAQFPTEFHSDWQWWDLVTKSRFMILDDFPPRLRPVVQVIDDWTTNRRLGLIFEAKVGEGKLLVTSIDLRSNLDDRPVARQMLFSLLKYVGSERFSPENRLDVESIRSLLRTPPVPAGAKVTVDSEAPGHEGVRAIDGDPETIWHTAWEPAAPEYPHQIQFELPKPVRIRGFRYLPRQDMKNGWISRYELLVSSDGQNWGDPVARGTFNRDRSEKQVLLDQPCEARFIRFVASAGIEGQAFASAAEFDVLGDQ